MNFKSIALIHICVALIYRYALGLRIETGGVGRWDRFWQTIPMESLRENLAESLWYLHAQPPLYNLYGAFWGRTFPADPLGAMHYGNILLGGLSAGMLYSMALEVTRNRTLAVAVGLAFALHPALFLFESYALYTLPASWAVMASLFFVSRHRASGRLGDLYAAILILNLLILTRSLFHIAILLLVIPFVALIAGREWRRVVAVCLGISLFSLAWYAKNGVVFDTFSSSSWTGQGLWKVVSARQPAGLIDELANEGLLDPVVAEIPSFSPPSRYVRYGFDRKFDVPALSRDDLHNGNLIEISRVYGDNAMRLIRHSPGPWLGSLFKSYRTFSMPAADHSFLAENADSISFHVATGHVLEGRWAAERLREVTGGKADFGSFFYFLMPVCSLAFAISALRRCKFRAESWASYIREDSILCFAWLLIGYTTVIGCLFEFGENNRFKFLIEGPFWLFAVSLAHRAYSKSSRRGETTSRR